MSERNQYLEQDGLYFESETHEWFHDKTSTNYARTDNGLNKDALKNIYCFVTRSKETGEYDRVMMNSKTNEVIFDTKSLEAMGFEIDRMKVAKRFKI
jgi:hypothetical protein